MQITWTWEVTDVDNHYDMIHFKYECEHSGNLYTRRADVKLGDKTLEALAQENCPTEWLKNVINDVKELDQYVGVNGTVEIEI